MRFLQPSDLAAVSLSSLPGLPWGGCIQRNPGNCRSTAQCLFTAFGVWSKSDQCNPLTTWVVGGREGEEGDMIDDSAEIRFQSFLQGVIVNCSSMGSDFHSLTLSIQHDSPPRRRATSKVPWRMVSDRLSWHVKKMLSRYTTLPHLTACFLTDCGLLLKHTSFTPSWLRVSTLIHEKPEFKHDVLRVSLQNGKLFAKDVTWRYEGREWVNRVLDERYSAGCSHFGFILGQNCSFLSFMPSWLQIITSLSPFRV